jgi:hypothetical protein
LEGLLAIPGRMCIHAEGLEQSDHGVARVVVVLNHEDAIIR